MAQYQHNFYGTSYYGDTNAFSGTYETYEILTEEPLKGTFDVNLKTRLPSVVYDFNTPEVVRAGTWSEDSGYLRSSTVASKLTFTGTADQIKIHYQARPDGATVNLKITSTLPGQAPIIDTATLDTNSVSVQDRTYSISQIPYARQELEISIPSGNSASSYFYFQDVEARVGSFTIETRARFGDAGAWTAYSSRPLTYTHGGLDYYTVTGTSPSYVGKDRIQVRVWMASSDNTVSPIIDELDTYAGDTDNRTEDASYNVTVDLSALAASLGKTFVSVESVDWMSTVPDGTNITLRSSSANLAKTIWSAWSVPYRKDISRARLKEGSNQGYFITGLINPASSNSNLRIDHWINWNDESFLPPDESSTRITYELLDESNNVLYKADQPKYLTDRNLMLNTVGSRPYRVKISLTKRVDKSSPVVDKLFFNSSLIYEERKITEKYGFSAVDEMNVGEKMILDMSTLTFNPPTEATAPTYFLEDQTERPRDVVLYLDSTKSLPASISRPNYTSSNVDKIWAKAIQDTTPTDGDITGVYKHYQYGGGTVVVSQPDSIPLAPAFTPALDSTKEYRYYTQLGWYDPKAGAMVPNTVNENCIVYWDSQKLDTTKTQVTEKSSQNAIVKGLSDKTSDSLIIEVQDSSTWGQVDWVSEEKIYVGTVNAGDEKNDYVRRHVTPDSGDSLEIKYKVLVGDTFAKIADTFQVDVNDLKYTNGDPQSEPVVGSTIIIPARIVLPKINPAAIVPTNPYVVDVIYNSVRQGGKVVPEDRIIVKSLIVDEQEVTIVKEKVVRGATVGGSDVLGNAKVTDVVGIWDLLDDPVQAPVYIEGLDYTLEGNFINWAPNGGTSKEPSAGASYYVSYKCMKPKAVTITIGCDYQEQDGIDHVWRSPEVKEFTGTCSPGVDFRQELPEPDTWDGAADPSIEDLTYIIEDNDLWVKSWVEYNADDSKYYAIGSLQDRVPKDNWFPYIKTGYYYVGEDEYYLFSEPITVEPEQNAMAMSENITYVDGKYDKAALFQRASTNLVQNSGFDVLGSKQIVHKVSFS